MKFDGFVGPTYTMDALTFDCQRSVNLFPIISETGTSKSVAALVSAPGYSQFATAGGGPVRGARTAASGRAFVVSGSELYEVNTGGTTTLRGTLLTAITRISMAENGTQLMIVDGTYGYIFNMGSNSFAQITDIHFPQCSTVTFQDGYFIVPQNNTPKFYISALYDGLSWDALDFSSADANPDNLVSAISDNGMLWLHGEISTEVFQNTGAAAFPFERVPGAIIQTGCASAQSIVSLDNSLFWLGVDNLGRGVVWRSSGLSITRVSTNAIEKIISETSELQGSYGYAYHEHGHAFYCLNVQNLKTTLVFDVSTNLWHERTFEDTTTNETQQHRGSCHFFFNQKNMIGDRVDGLIYQQSVDLYSYNGEPIHRERISPHVSSEKKNLPFSVLELDIETGVGLQSGQGSNPQIMMRYSDDGGRTWSNERWTTIGAIGKYKTRVRWTRCGSARDRVFKVKYTDPTQFQINDAYLNNG
jgi:hypothetical protein